MTTDLYKYEIAARPWTHHFPLKIWNTVSTRNHCVCFSLPVSSTGAHVCTAPIQLHIPNHPPFSYPTHYVIMIHYCHTTYNIVSQNSHCSHREKRSLHKKTPKHKLRSFSVFYHISNAVIFLESLRNVPNWCHLRPLQLGLVTTSLKSEKTDAVGLERSELSRLLQRVPHLCWRLQALGLHYCH